MFYSEFNVGIFNAVAHDLLYPSTDSHFYMKRQSRSLGGHTEPTQCTEICCQVSIMH